MQKVIFFIILLAGFNVTLLFCKDTALSEKKRYALVIGNNYGNDR